MFGQEGQAFGKLLILIDLPPSPHCCRDAKD
jgi:hypothetical protein